MVARPLAQPLALADLLAVVSKRPELAAEREVEVSEEAGWESVGESEVAESASVSGQAAGE